MFTVPCLAPALAFLLDPGLDLPWLVLLGLATLGPMVLALRNVIPHVRRKRSELLARLRHQARNKGVALGADF
eukprot:scaffold122194_cov55-Prasinocladus_malaysianus.AAC.1